MITPLGNPTTDPIIFLSQALSVPLRPKPGYFGYPPCRVDMKTISSLSCRMYSPSPSNSQSVSFISTRIPGRLGNPSDALSGSEFCAGRTLCHLREKDPPALGVDYLSANVSAPSHRNVCHRQFLRESRPCETFVSRRGARAPLRTRLGLIWWLSWSKS